MRVDVKTWNRVFKAVALKNKGFSERLFLASAWFHRLLLVKYVHLLGQEKLNIAFFSAVSQDFVSLSKFHVSLVIQFGPLLTWKQFVLFHFSMKSAKQYLA